jgi:hypothetical protein
MINEQPRFVGEIMSRDVGTVEEDATLENLDESNPCGSRRAARQDRARADDALRDMLASSGNRVLHEGGESCIGEGR